jgi:hypothetical protein
MGSKQLDQLLARLDSRSDDGLGGALVQGKAVSKSDEYLHVATSTGLLAVPIAEIEEVVELATRGDESGLMVSLRVRDLETVRPLLTIVNPLYDPPRPGTGGEWGPVVLPPDVDPWGPLAVDGGTGTFKYSKTLDCVDTTSKGQADDSRCQSYSDSEPE